MGDANYINDGGASNRNGTPFLGDFVGPSDLDDAGDLMRLWFRNDDQTLSLHIQTEAAPSREGVTRIYRVHANPTHTVVDPTDPSDCLLWRVSVGDDGGHLSTNQAVLVDVCRSQRTNEWQGLSVMLDIKKRIDGTGIITVIAPRSFTEQFSTDETLEGVWATAVVGYGQTWEIDTTKRGRSYAIRD